MSVAAGFSSSFFIDESDKVWACGPNAVLQRPTKNKIGVWSRFSSILNKKEKVVFSNNTGSISQFARLEELSDIFAVSSGSNHHLILNEEGTVWSYGPISCWPPQNVNSRLGRDGYARVPHIIPNLPPIEAVSASLANHSLYLDFDGRVWATGANEAGQVATSGCSLEQPTIIDDIPQIKSLATGTHHSVFLDINGTPWACGNNTSGQLGLGDFQGRNKPTRIENLPPILAVSCGTEHTIFLAEDGSVWGTGNNRVGQLGKIKSSSTSTVIENIPFIKMTAVGLDFSFFLDETGCVWACGSNGQGQLGLSDMSVRSVFQPCQIVQSQSMQNIAAGARHSLFVDVEGTLWCCGDNTNNIFGITTHKHVHLLQKIEDVPRIRMNCQHRSVKSARMV